MPFMQMEAAAFAAERILRAAPCRWKRHNARFALVRPYPQVDQNRSGWHWFGRLQEATIVSFSPHTRPDGTGMGLLGETPAALAQRITWVRQAAGAQFTDLELHIHLADVVVTDDREHVAHVLATAQTFGAGVMPHRFVTSGGIVWRLAVPKRFASTMPLEG